MAKHAKTPGASTGIPEHADAESCQDLPESAETCPDLPEVAEVCHDLPCKNKNKEYKNKDIRYTEKEEGGEEEISSCSEPPSAVSELPSVEIPLNDGTEYPLFRRDLEEYAALYPAVNIEQELRNMRGWCLANPTRRKTKISVKAFINSWLSKTQKEKELKPDPPENPFLAYARGEKESHVIRF